MSMIRLLKFVFIISLFVLMSQTWAADAPQTSPAQIDEAVIASLPEAPITLDLREADLPSLLRTLGQQFKLNFLVHEDVKGQITISLQNVPLRDALQGIARANGLIFLPGPGSIIEILSLQGHQARLQQLAAALPKLEAPSLITQKVEIRYAFNPRDSISAVGRTINLSAKQIKDLTELADLLRKRLSGRPGSDIAIISRINSLVITDIPQKVAEIVAVIQAIDVANESVGIEARIVEVTSQALEDLGVQWGVRTKTGALTIGGGVRGVEVETEKGTVSRTIPQSGQASASGSNFIVNLPANLQLGGPGGSLAFTIAQGASQFLDLQISALEQEGKLKLLAAPKLTTMNHERAWIESGREIPYTSTVATSGTTIATTEFKNATIELEVTPHIIKNGSSPAIALDVMVTRKEADFTQRIGQNLNPPLFTRTVYTRALVQNSETAVIGGLIREDSTNNLDKIPFLGDLPAFGWLFKRTEKREDKNYLLIFLTPTILPTPLTAAATKGGSAP
jgi:type IV pilus assembly protein PilQ